MAKQILLCRLSFLFSLPTAAAFQQGKIPPTPFPGGPPPGESFNWRKTVVISFAVVESSVKQEYTCTYNHSVLLQLFSRDGNLFVS